MHQKTTRRVHDNRPKRRQEENEILGKERIPDEEERENTGRVMKKRVQDDGTGREYEMRENDKERKRKYVYNY